MQPPSDATPPSDNLQFDRAEYSADPAAPAVAMCGICHNTLRDRYYDINGQPACVSCHDRTVADMNRGSRFGRAFKALALGLVASVIGAAIYFGIAALTGYQIGIVAIVLGLIVGVAVRMGSNGRGGWFYQLLAIALTYFAISLAYSSLAILEMAKDPESLLRSLDAAASQPAADFNGTTTHPATSRPAPISQPSDEHQSDGTFRDSAQASPTHRNDWENLSTGERTFAIAVATVFVAAIIFALPVMSAMDQPIGFLIIGIALWQAWATNKGAKVRIAGPYAVAGAAPPTAPPSLPNGPSNA